QSIPAPAAENPTAQPFLRGPCRGEKKRKHEVVCRFCPWRSRRSCCTASLGQHLIPFCRVRFLLFFFRPDQSAKARPQCDINRHIELENKPAEDRDSCEPRESGPEKCYSRDVPQPKIPKPAMSRFLSGKPNGGD